MCETEVCLKWNTFQECILSSFGLLWQEDQLTDVSITAGNDVLHAHKVILSACSPFFTKIFQETSCKHPTIILPGADASDLKKILAFIYKGEVFIEQERLSPFLRLAEELQIRGLWKPDEKEVGKNL
ncbi:hypothetical protein LSTR_LSTR004788 [Laodelphax striatellus]|uniref:BTB domain-containing protein n=1 Tax=Laodelphax striatellus TaxID=195883 RepID=A0A482XJ49_LAOST|nr:hypothetical protein LSTR_LSTR004788 [Laodelphax striatellus]